MDDLIYSACMSQFFMGISDARWPNPGYAEKLPFFELHLRSPLPKPNVLKKWRASLDASLPNSSLKVALVAPYLKEVCKANPDWSIQEAVDSICDWSLASAEAIGAEFLIAATQASVTTGQRDRDELSLYFEALAQDTSTDSKGPPLNVVWIPSGLWELTQAKNQADKMGVLLGFDPTQDDFDPSVFSEEKMIYARVRALGSRARLSDESLFRVVQNLLFCDSEQTFVSIHSQRAFKDAQRLRSMLEEVSE